MQPYKPEDLKAGMVFEFIEKITVNDIDQFAALSGDNNPLHMDEKFAVRKNFKTRIVHGAYLSALISRLVGMYCPGENALLHSMNLKFKKPVYPNTSVKIIGTISYISLENRVLLMDIEIVDSDSKTVLMQGKIQTGFTNDFEV